MEDRAYLVNKTLELKIAIAENNDQNTLIVTIDALKEIFSLLKEQEDDKPKGHWMPYEPDKRGYTDGFTCSRCERVILSDHYCKMIDFDFCPYCGAYMDNAEGR